MSIVQTILILIVNPPTRHNTNNNENNHTQRLRSGQRNGFSINNNLHHNPSGKGANNNLMTKTTKGATPKNRGGIRWTAAEYEQVRQAAAKVNRTWSNYVKTAALVAAERGQI